MTDERIAEEKATEAKIAACPPPLQEIIQEFREADPRDRIEYLIDFAMEMPDLPPELQARRDQMEQVHECMTPVFLFTEIKDGRVQFHFDIPRESPTVRGYAAILAQGLNNATPEEVLATPDDIYLLLGLHQAISPQRLRGLHALMRVMKRQVTQALS